VRFLRLYSVIFLVAMSVLSIDPAAAQDGCDDCAERYVEIANKRGLQAEIDYLLPSDELDLDRTKTKKEKKQSNGEPDLSAPGNLGWFLISGVILAGLGILIYQNSAGGLVSFSSRPEDGSRVETRRGGVRNDTPDHNDLPKSDVAFLAGIEQMADRQKALHLLSGRLLANASEQSGIRPGRSWTARESLRALPRTLAHMTDLRHINREAELAWFGGREVDDTVFDECLARARGVMRGRVTS